MNRHKRCKVWWRIACAAAVLFLSRPGCLRAAETPAFNGGRAFEDLKHLVAFGPRPAGSRELAQARAWIVQQLRSTRAQLEEDSFQVSTPAGVLSMSNIVAKFPGARPQVVIIGGHYDTKRFQDFRFVGANDGGSSAALLLELARVLSARQNDLTYWLVFFDGEESVPREWSDADSLYGSRHFVQNLTARGELGRVQAMILVDMVGDAKLDIRMEDNSTPWLADLVFATARRLGYDRYFPPGRLTPVEDDHMPFVNAGVSAVDVIDFDYGPDNRYWHAAGDTVEHCSPLSLTIVGRVVVATLAALEKSPRLK